MSNPFLVTIDNITNITTVHNPGLGTDLLILPDERIVDLQVFAQMCTRYDWVMTASLIVCLACLLIKLSNARLRKMAQTREHTMGKEWVENITRTADDLLDMTLIFVIITNLATIAYKAWGG